jgi:hypothetical protein
VISHAWLEANGAELVKLALISQGGEVALQILEGLAGGSGKCLCFTVCGM